MWPPSSGVNTSPHSCGPIAEAPFSTAAFSHSPPPPPRYSLLLHRALPPPPKIFSVATQSRSKSGAVLVFARGFGHEDFIERKSLLKSLERA
jgi:hypothetical protein